MFLIIFFNLIKTLLRSIRLDISIKYNPNIGELMKKIFFGAIMAAMMFVNAKALNAELLDVAKSEMQRAYQELQKQSQPPYYIGYSITDVYNRRLSSSFGKIETADSNRTRVLDIDLRVGSPALDNTHIIRGQRMSFSIAPTSFALPIENNSTAIKKDIWLATDRVYKSALETFDKVVTNKKVKVAEEDSSADFSIEKSVQYSEPVKEINIDWAKWEDLVNRVSAEFLKDNRIYFGKVSLSLETLVKYYIATDGTEIRQFQPFIRIYISGSTKADDGMSLPLYKSYFAFLPEQMPSEATLMKDVNELMVTLKQLREAPLMTTYSGPALMSGEASGVFFHEIFGHRVEGHRQKDPDDAQTFKNSLNQLVISPVINVTFDPTINEMNGKILSGYYKFDDEGIPSQRVSVVERGIFKNFLMSRSPIQGFEHSNGHGRKEYGSKACSRQSNLIVKSEKIMPMKDLRQLLLDEAKKQGKEFALYFVDVQGGFTFTGRAIPNSFNVNPLLVYKIYVDGRPDEMVRGVDLIGTPLTTFSHIVATADDFGVFNGICGAESGSVPVSACSPTLLVSKIEVQKKKKSQAKLPILDAPQSNVNP